MAIEKRQYVDYCKQMEEEKTMGDEEARHGHADKIILAFLKTAGYRRLHDLYKETLDGTWCA